MTDKKEYKDTKLFKALISQNHIMAMVSMGRMINPQTGKLEKNLEQTKYCIAILEMLKNRTESRRTKEEDDYLKGIIAQLKYNYEEFIRN